MSRTGLSLSVSGTAAQVQSVFSTWIDRYRLASGKTGVRNRSAPELPATIAPAVEGVIGLDTLSPPQPTTNPLEPAPTGSAAAGPTAGASPALAPNQPSPGVSCQTAVNHQRNKFGARDAVDLSQAYSFDPLYASGHYGSGTTVALVELSGAGYNQSDIDTFANCYGVGDGQVSQVDLDGGGAIGGNTVEAELDIETVLSLAPSANIEVYRGRRLGRDLQRLEHDRQPGHRQDRECQLDERMRVLRGAVPPELGEHPPPGRRPRRAVRLRGDRRPGLGSVQRQRRRLRTDGIEPGRSGRRCHHRYRLCRQRVVRQRERRERGHDERSFDFVTAGSVTTGSGPDAITLDSALGEVFVANASTSSLTAFSTSTCNQTTTTGCASPTQIASGGRLSGPEAIVASGSTLYVGNSNGTVAVYNANTNAWVASVTLPSGSVPSALAIDSTNGFVYVADSAHGRVEYFNSSTCSASVTTGCSATPSAVSVGQDPISLAVDTAAGSLYVANAGSPGGISVVSLSTHAVTTTISTGPSVPGLDGSHFAESVGLSPDGTKILAAPDGQCDG